MTFVNNTLVSIWSAYSTNCSIYKSKTVFEWTSLSFDCSSGRFQERRCKKCLVPWSQTKTMKFVDLVKYSVCCKTQFRNQTSKPLNELKIPTRMSDLLRGMQNPSIPSQTVPWEHLNLAGTCKASAIKGMSSFSRLNSDSHSLKCKQSKQNGSNTQYG